MIYEEDELLLLSGIQHFAFCKRQWALIHIEQQWQENVLTYEGRELHKKADNPYLKEVRGDVLITRAMPLVSHDLGIYGVADVIEFHSELEPDNEHCVVLPRRKGWWRPFPIEYKRGKAKANDCDELQLCVQAICLEEMLEVTVAEGAIFYGETERRTSVVFDEHLRDRVTILLSEMRSLFTTGETPAAVYEPKCKSCSLYDICLPKLKKTGFDDLHRYLRELNE